MYALIRKLLFQLDAERAHQCALLVLKYLPQCLFPMPCAKPVDAMGLHFPHALGLAAGMDKNGDYLDALGKLGFAFIELGTVTPKPQLGNPKPRLFRLPQEAAIINRMGFNNRGVDALIQNVMRAHYQGILGINIGMNRDTSLDRAVDDYTHCMRKVYAHADYITVNISSPNTPDLRKLQTRAFFCQLIHSLREEQLHLADKHQTYVPLLIKVSPDESDELLKYMVSEMVTTGIDGVVAVNTTVSRDNISSQHPGGLSGRPLSARANACCALIKNTVGDALTIVGTGGIDSATSAKQRLASGATLLQIYSGLIYQGPWLVGDIVKQLPQHLAD